MKTYQEILDELFNNLEKINLGDNLEAWFGAIEKDENGNWHKKEMPELKNNSNDTKTCKCDSKKYDKVSHINTYTSEAYHITETNDKFELEVLIPGETVENFTVTVNTKNNTLTVVRKNENDTLRWCSTEHFNITIELPEGIIYDSLKKTYENGILIITGKIATNESFEKEI